MLNSVDSITKQKSGVEAAVGWGWEWGWFSWVPPEQSWSGSFSAAGQTCLRGEWTDPSAKRVPGYLVG